MEPLSPLYCFPAAICCDHCIRLILTVTEGTTFTMLSRAINILLVELSLEPKMIRSTDIISRFGIYEMIQLGHEHVYVRSCQNTLYGTGRAYLVYFP